MRDSDRYRLERMAEIGRLLLETIEGEGITAESLMSDYRQQWLVSTPLYNIGEQAYCLSAEFKDSHPDVEWAGVAGLRHRLAHDYEGTNWGLVASIVECDLPGLVSDVLRMLSEG